MGGWFKAAVLGTVLLAPTARAADISVVGLFPNKAVVMVDGGNPKTVAVGQKIADGVTLVGVERDSAVFDVGGKRQIIRIGQAQSSQRASAGASVSLTADERGHYFADGQINGQAVRFVVDTGATLVALSSTDAQRLGINYLEGGEIRMTTANGLARAWRVKLDSVRVGGITLNGVEAVVMENQSMPALLGMSFLNRMEMRREGAQMTLIKRF